MDIQKGRNLPIFLAIDEEVDVVEITMFINLFTCVGSLRTLLLIGARPN